MKNPKKIILITISILVIIIIILIYWLNRDKIKNANTIINQNTPSEFIDIDKKPPVQYTDTRLQEITSTAMLISVQNCINKYYEYNYAGDSKALYNIINIEYAKNKGINESNIFKDINKVNQKMKFFALKINQKEISFDHEYQYFVYGKTYSEQYKYLNNEVFIVNLDVHNFTFYIIPYGSATEERYNKLIQDITSQDNGKIQKTGDSEITSIEQNDYNTFTVEKYEKLYKQIIENYCKFYYFLEINDKKSAYELLNEVYRKFKFDSEKSYYEYIEKNKENEINISYVKKEINESEVTYIGIDDKGHYYIVKEKKPMDFTLMLDSYTLPLTETTQKYNSASDIEKACMCLETIKEMINTNDYNGVYKHLNQDFKERYFTNITDLENQIKKYYFDNIDFKYIDYKKEGDNFIITVGMSTQEATDVKEDKLTEEKFIVKLGSNITDFELSFKVN